MTKFSIRNLCHPVANNEMMNNEMMNKWGPSGTYATRMYTDLKKIQALNGIQCAMVYQLSYQSHMRAVKV